MLTIVKRAATAAFSLLALTMPALAQSELSAEQGLECFVWLDVDAAMAEYEQVLVTEAPTSDLAFAPFFLMPRYQSAIGQPGFAFLAITEWLGATAGNEYELWGNPTGGLHLTSSQLVTDPLPADDETEPPDALAIKDVEIGGDALIVAARLLTRSGEKARAGALFARALDIARETTEGSMWQRARYLESLFAMWAASGLGVNAAEAARDLDTADGALARLAIAEGLALTGDVTATTDAAGNLSGSLPLMGELTIAEAWRRHGETEQARATLDHAAQALDTGSSATRMPETYRRLAQGYALVGETALAQRLMLASVTERRLRDGLAWTDITPMIACHDLDMALGLVAEGAGGSGQSDPMAVVDVLIAAAASGAGKAAYTFAMNQPELVNRTLYLLATAIGLRHGKLAADPALPCATVTVVGD